LSWAIPPSKAFRAAHARLQLVRGENHESEGFSGDVIHSQA
jgi:hypothetical protein